jgi:hypothetical protein
MARGGTLDADAELGLRAWQHLKAVLGLDDSEVVRCRAQPDVTKAAGPGGPAPLPLLLERRHRQPQAHSGGMSV